MLRFKSWYIFLALLSLMLPSALLIKVSPVYAASIALKPESGTVGTSVFVTGEGFTGRQALIKWDGKIVAEKVPIDAKGKMSCTITVPRAAKGNYTIEVTDDSHWSGSAASATFKVMPKIEVLPKVARQTSEISVVGTGFPAGETGITLTWDDMALKGTPATADLRGTWSINLNVPIASKGAHYIGASGSITSASEIERAVFIIGPTAKVEPLSGPVGTEIKAEGFGFRVGEDGITIDFDDEIIVCNIAASGDGSWKSTALIPPSTRGSHKITVYGSSFTPKGTVPDFAFEVTSSIQLEPTFGNQGNKVTVRGTGFAKNEIITLAFNNVPLDVQAVADDKGSFNSTFLVPLLKGKDHVVSATGNSGNSAKAAFTANKPPPAAPQLKNPTPDTQITIFNSVGDVITRTLKYATSLIFRPRNQQYPYHQAAKAIFIWSPPSHAEDAKYTLQIAPQDDFTALTIAKNNLQNPRYICSQEDILLPGTYYWRVKAIDSVGNESAWSEVWRFEIIPMSTTVLILSIIIPAIFTMLVLAPILITWRSRRRTW